MVVFTECPPGFYGEECGGRCHCKEGTCNLNSGLNCSGGCAEGYTGDTCTERLTTTPTEMTKTFSVSTSASTGRC